MKQLLEEGVCSGLVQKIIAPKMFRKAGRSCHAMDSSKRTLLQDLSIKCSIFDPKVGDASKIPSKIEATYPFLALLPIF